jgi:hypothetical protein
MVGEEQKPLKARNMRPPKAGKTGPQNARLPKSRAEKLALAKKLLAADAAGEEIDPSERALLNLSIVLDANPSLRKLVRNELFKDTVQMVSTDKRWQNVSYLLLAGLIVNEIPSTDDMRDRVIDFMSMYGMNLEAVAQTSDWDNA